VFFNGLFFFPVMTPVSLQGMALDARTCKIGLLGGSFDPLHNGHLMIAKQAIHLLNLHYLILMITPKNPFKTHQPQSIHERVLQCHTLFKNPKILVSHFEEHHHIQQTADTVDLLVSQYPQAQFVWIMGADNLTHFHTWDGWAERIVMKIPIAIFSRPSFTLSAGCSVFAQRFSKYRRPLSTALSLPSCTPPAWVLIDTWETKKISSTELRIKKEHMAQK
jgi:nicotinate-nucleotide adenylyltransferase